MHFKEALELSITGDSLYTTDMQTMVWKFLF